MYKNDLAIPSQQPVHIVRNFLLFDLTITWVLLLLFSPDYSINLILDNMCLILSMGDIYLVQCSMPCIVDRICARDKNFAWLTRPVSQQQMSDKKIR